VFTSVDKCYIGASMILLCYHIVINATTPSALRRVSQNTETKQNSFLKYHV